MTLAVLAAIGSLSWPLGRDQGFFVWIGSVILDGGIPYRDAWDLKGPLTYYVCAFALAVFRHPEFSIRAVDLVVMFLCCWLLRRLTLRLTACDVWAANCAWALFALIYYGGGFWCTAQPDGWAGGLLLAAIVLLLEKPWSLRCTLAIAGALIGLAAQFKIVYAIFLIIPFYFLADTSFDKARRIEALACCALAFGAVNLAFLALLGWHDALNDYFDVFRFISSSYLPPRDFLAESPALVAALLYQGLLVPLLSAPIAMWFLRDRGMQRESLIVATWVALTIVIVAAQGRYWPYHWIPAAMALATTFGVALAGKSVALTSHSGRRATMVLVLCVYILGVWWPTKRTIEGNYSWPAYAVGLQSPEEYIERVTGSWWWPAYRSYKTASTYVQERSGPTDKVLLFGYDTLINVFSERQMPTRFAVPQAPTTRGPLQAKYRRMFMEELSSSPPLYIIVDADSPWPFQDQSGLEVLNDFPRFSEFLHVRYVLVTRIEGLQVWRLSERYETSSDLARSDFKGARDGRDLSEFSCSRHIMTYRSRYAEKEEIQRPDRDADHR